jgi:hypothetical protein
MEDGLQIFFDMERQILQHEHDIVINILTVCVGGHCSGKRNFTHLYAVLDNMKTEWDHFVASSFKGCNYYYIFMGLQVVLLLLNTYA